MFHIKIYQKNVSKSYQEQQIYIDAKNCKIIMQASTDSVGLKMLTLWPPDQYKGPCGVKGLTRINIFRGMFKNLYHSQELQWNNICDINL